MTRFLGALLLTTVLALPALAGGTEQDTVKLKSGRVLSGIVLLDDTNREGFTVQRWDTGGTVLVRWTQITEMERSRLLNRVTEIKVAGVMLDGVRAMTAGRDVVGVLVKEDANGLHIKTADSKSPVQIPKSALLRPHEALKILESDAYSPDEMVDQHLAKANEKDYQSMMEVGVFAASVKLYERAKEFYQKAAAADPSKKDESDAVIAKNEGLIKEGKANAILLQVKELVKTTEFAKAVETAKKMLAEFGDTEVAKQNKDLVSQLEKKAKDYDTNRAEYLAESVPQAYKDRRTVLFGLYGSTKLKIAEALAKANKIDEEVVAELAKRNKATPEEINAAWAKRELKARTVGYGDGSWIVKGGQDGGLDTDAKTQPNNANGNTGGNGKGNGGFGFGGDKGGNRGGNTGGNNKGGQNANQPQPLGKKLETKDEWWATASSSDRRNFVEAEYAKNSGAVKKEVKTKKCSVCNGEGIRKEVRQGVSCDCKCLRCHGAKEDDIVVYQ
jgi:tetratricopeptide (TPR) repeat protein